MSRLNLAILISGRGTNMDQILRATTSEDYPARARLVLSNREDAAGLEAARAFGVATETVPHTDYEDRQSFERAMHEALTRHEIEIIALLQPACINLRMVARMRHTRHSTPIA